MGGPIYRLWHQKQWMDDENYGPTMYRRLDELAAIRSNAEDLSEVEQERTARELMRPLSEDPSPLYRAQVVRTLGSLSTPVATDGLRLALQDDDSQVRIQACRAWTRHGGPEAVNALSHVLRTDADLDVRMAATRQLAEFRDPTAVSTLGLALDDADPAIQFRAMQSLKSITGKDFGNNVPAWRQYVKDGTYQPSDTPSIADRVREFF
jgi:HEAT repeat protein